MIEIKAKVHDKFSVEMKQSFISGNDSASKKHDFVVNTWIFVPNSLDINPETYGKEQFWRDTKSNIRLITPSVPLDKVAGAPLDHLKSCSSEDFSYQVKMFCSIAKSALREACDDFEPITFAAGAESAMRGYWELKERVPSDSESRKIYSFGDEFLGTIAKFYAMKMLARIDSGVLEGNGRGQLVSCIKMIDADRKAKGYPVPEPGNRKMNNSFVHRHGLLKKYLESVLFVSLDKKKDGVAVEQSLYAVAAGLAMIFATVVSFSVQRAYGSLSIPLFFALIFSYMIKDRIKELSRYWFVHKLGKRYYDNKSKLFIKGNVVGMVKEGVDFIDSERVPAKVKELRNQESMFRTGDDIFDERIILYRKLVTLDPNKLGELGPYPIEGVNDIFRFHLSRFTQKMDNPEHRIPILDEYGNCAAATGLKSYPINIVQQIREGDDVQYKRMRVVLSRNGIESIKEFRTRQK